ncbi:hypothetical protein GJAV_G00141000 [Gymnothorax javanicus]|nr:hypothetical protein GJAV_G00141000 [Gymnothorax javanicus]
MMQAGVCLRQDTETTLPELTEQHRIRQKEEELNGLESVHMAESETECAAPGLNTLEPECVTAHSGVRDVHHTHTSLIKTETDLGSTHSGDLIKMESLDSTELGYVTHLHPDQIKTEPDDGGYLTSEQISDLQDTQCVDMESDQVKCESGVTLVSDLMNTVKTEAAGDLEEPTEPWQCAGEPNSSCKPEETHDLLTHSGDFNHQFQNNQPRIVLERVNRRNKPVLRRRRNGKTVQKVLNSNAESGKGFASKSHLKQDLCTGEKSLKCSQCGKCLASKYSLKLHQKSHTGEKPYECSQCGKAFSRNYALKRHLQIHAGKKPFKCSQCGKSFSRKYVMNRHLQMHTGEKPYKCSQCEKSFSQSHFLDRHLQMHTGKTPYKCSQCEKSFPHNEGLKRHLETHTGEKPYKCSQCGKYFSQKYGLRRHLEMHTGEKPYTCSLCWKSFARMDYLSVHLRVHTD